MVASISIYIISDIGVVAMSRSHKLITLASYTTHKIV